MLTIVEHRSSSYGPRTFHNAKAADLTVAIAVDYSTHGEKLTMKAAGARFIACPFKTDVIINSRELYKALYRWRASVLNVAGNGIYTFGKYNIDQERVNQYIFDVIAKVHQHYPLAGIVSGGQTGADIAGAAVGYKLDIPTTVTFPHGFKQRDVTGRDSNHTQSEIRQQIVDFAQKIYTV